MNALRRWEAPGERSPGVCILHGPGDDGDWLATASGCIDHQNGIILDHALTAATEFGSRTTTVDLCAVAYTDSTLLHTLLAAQRTHRNRGAHLLLASPAHPAVERLLDITGARTYFTFTTATGAHRHCTSTRCLARPRGSAS